MNKTISYIRAIYLFAILSLLSAGSTLAAEKGTDFDKLLRDWDRSITKIEKRISTGRTGTLEERELRVQLKEIADVAASERETVIKQVKQSKALLDSLGLTPTEDGKTESDSVQKRRKLLAHDLALYEGQAKQAGLIIAKADQAMAKIASLSRERLKVLLFERTLTPLNPSAWAIAFPEAGKLLQTSFQDLPTSWWKQVGNEAGLSNSIYRNLAIALMAAVFGWAVGAWLRKRYGRVQGIERPGYGRRLLAGLVEGGGRSLGPIIFVVLMGLLVLDRDVANEQFRTVVDGTVRSFVIFFLGYALINAGLTSRRQEWRILEFDEEASRRLSSRLKMTLFVFLIFEALRVSTSWATPSLELRSISTFLFVVLMVTLLLGLMASRIWGPLSTSIDDDVVETTYPRFRTFLTVGLVSLPIVAVVGYPGLAAYIVSAIVMSALALAGLLLFRTIGRESLTTFFDAQKQVGRKVRSVLALGREATQRTLFWLFLFFDFGLLILAGIFLLQIWGFGAEDSAMSLAKLVRGVQIGSFTFSIVDLLVGLTLFAAIIFMTRLIQTGLDRHILPNMTKDKGVQDALKTGVGYIGTIIAFLVAVAVLGIDLTNLALIAGALSVGLGFGLQNVVNNFVSGLILLAERPIKPGDWVVVGGHEGKVKKVNVRSTEVETFQRASVIIPNADLIASPVMNWTHKNVLGRVEVVVGVSYGTDPYLVKDVLIKCAKAHPNVVAYPEASVLFSNFGDSSLNFELRAYLADVEQRLQTGSELRFAIYDAFREQDIEIPFPQRVVHMAPISNSRNTPSPTDAEGQAVDE
ncbi:MAG: DUF3772 domain-containing protein [Magnetovibrio sp.]|nr:DUF3772 domain-containing protein [Magnetovibrio sp.]